MPIRGMNHFTVLTSDLAATRDFYIGLLKVWLGEDPAQNDLKQALLGKPQ